MKYVRLTVVLFAVLLSSCEDNFFDERIASADANENFAYLWNQCDKKYSYFDVKNIDWDSIKVQYSARIYKGMTEDSLFNVLGAMLRELKDDHTNLVSDFNISRYGTDRKGPDNFDWRVVTDNYLPVNYYTSGPFYHDFICDEKIGYIRFPSFTGGVDDDNLDFVLKRYINTKGLILDMRENGGGATTDIFNLLSRFVEEKTVLYYSRIKNGSGHADFSEPEPAYVLPYDGLRYKNKVAILVDRGTYSAGSFTALASKAIPNMFLVGDTTGGGLGMPNGGQLPNGWTYRFSITQALTLDKKPDYENGVPPEFYTLFDWTDLTKDEVIEKAISKLLK